MRAHRSGYGLNRRWQGNYMQSESSAASGASAGGFGGGNNNNSLGGLQAKENVREILLATRVRKFNRHFKSSDRVLVVSDACIFKLDAKNMKPMTGGRINLADVSTSVHLSA